MQKRNGRWDLRLRWGLWKQQRFASLGRRRRNGASQWCSRERRGPRRRSSRRTWRRREDRRRGARSTSSGRRGGGRRRRKGGTCRRGACWPRGHSSPCTSGMSCVWEGQAQRQARRNPWSDSWAHIPPAHHDTSTAFKIQQRILHQYTHSHFYLLVWSGSSVAWVGETVPKLLRNENEMPRTRVQQRSPSLK